MMKKFGIFLVFVLGIIGFQSCDDSKTYAELKEEEREAINRAIGRYNGLVVKKGFEEASETLKEFGKQIPSYVEGFMSAFEDIENR